MIGLSRSRLLSLRSQTTIKQLHKTLIEFLTARATPDCNLFVHTRAVCGAWP